MPDGEPASRPPTRTLAANIVDPAWAAIDWTLRRAMRTARFWWIALGFFCALFAWYAVQVHQTKYLIEIGFDPIGRPGPWAWSACSRSRARSRSATLGPDRARMGVDGGLRRLRALLRGAAADAPTRRRRCCSTDGRRAGHARLRR